MIQSIWKITKSPDKDWKSLFKTEDLNFFAYDPNTSAPVGEASKNKQTNKQ